jgi:Flp pilus assembly protein TadG
MLNSAWEEMMKSLKDESGQVLVLSVLSMSLLIGFLALAVDVGTLFRAKRLMQTAADSAAIAGAQEYPYGDYQTAGRAAAAQNGVVVGTNGGDVTINAKPLSGPFLNQLGYVEAIVSQSQPTFFGKIFTGSMFRNSVAVTARAVATLGPGQGCIYTLGTSGTDISMSNGARLNAPGCGIFDNSGSTSPPAASVVGGATITAAAVGVVGAVSTNNGGAISPTAVTGIAPVSDPLASLQPPTFNVGSCLPDPVHGAFGNYSIGPGAGGSVCYNGLNIANGASVALAPGLYIINGAMTIAGGTTISGTGVTFYFPTPSGSFALNNGATLSLAAPTTGTYEGMLLWEASGNMNPINIAGGTSSTLKGVIYAPSAALSLSNNAGSQVYVDLVVNSLSIVGGANLQSYASLPGVSSPITGVRLVE